MRGPLREPAARLLMRERAALALRRLPMLIGPLPRGSPAVRPV